MEYFENNSDTYRRASSQDNNLIAAGTVPNQGKKEEPRPEPIITGEVHKKKQTAGDKMKKLFIKEDTKSVFSYVFNDILVPALGNTIVDMIRNGAEMIFLGSARGPRTYNSNPGSGRIRYDSYYDRRDFDQDYRGRYPQRPSMPTYSYDDITFESRADAEAVLVRLKERIYESGAVSVAFLYSLVHWQSDYTADGYGWRDLRDAQVVLVRDGYWLRLPRPVVI